MTERKLSRRAQKLLARVRDGHWYMPYTPGREPKAMKELVDAGLVTLGGRVKIIALAFVPVGTVPFVCEKYPETYPE